MSNELCNCSKCGWCVNGVCAYCVQTATVEVFIVEDVMEERIYSKLVPNYNKYTLSNFDKSEAIIKLLSKFEYRQFNPSIRNRDVLEKDIYMFEGIIAFAGTSCMYEPDVKDYVMGKCCYMRDKVINELDSRNKEFNFIKGKVPEKYNPWVEISGYNKTHGVDHRYPDDNSRGDSMSSGIFEDMNGAGFEKWKRAGYIAIHAIKL